MTTPPSMKVFNEVKAGASDVYAHRLIADKLIPDFKKSEALTNNIEYIQHTNNVVGTYMPNTYNALDKKYKPEDVVEKTIKAGIHTRRVTFIPVDTLRRRLADAFELDRKVIRDGWRKVRNEANAQIQNFTEAADEDSSPETKRARVDAD